jgi:hypothetical protein
VEAALDVLGSRGPAAAVRRAGTRPPPEEVCEFIRRERDALLALQDGIRGRIPLEPDGLETLLDETDYLWSHFPDCAGAGGRRPNGTDLSFLKRVLVEIEPLLKRFNRALDSLGGNVDTPHA